MQYFPLQKYAMIENCESPIDIINVDAQQTIEIWDKHVNERFIVVNPISCSC